MTATSIVIVLSLRLSASVSNQIITTKEIPRKSTIAFAGFFFNLYTLHSILYILSPLPSPANIFDNFFSATSQLWHGDLSLRSLGESGELIATPLNNDDYIIAAILLMTIISLFTGKIAFPFIQYKLDSLSHPPSEQSYTLRETIKKSSYLNYFIFQGMLLAALLTYACCIEMGHITAYPAPGRYVVIGIYAIAYFLYVVIRAIATRVVGATFFALSQRRMSNIERHFFLALDSVLLLPVIIMYLFLGCSATTCLYILLGAFIITKVIYLYKVYCIFFKKNALFNDF